MLNYLIHNEIISSTIVYEQDALFSISYLWIQGPSLGIDSAFLKNKDLMIGLRPDDTTET